VAAVLSCVVPAAAAAPAEKPAPWGWRGDGTGLFPNADPPVKWGRISATLKGLTTQAAKPAGDGLGTNAATYGNIPEWLVLGPFSYDPKAEVADLLAKEFVPGEATLRPSLGEKVGSAEWKKVPSTGSLLNLKGHYPDMTARIFYAHAYLHSKDGGRVMMRLMGPTCRFWLNGQEIGSLEEKELRHIDKEAELQKGWNSLLVKVFTSQRTDNWADMYNMPTNSGFFQVVLWGRSADEQFESPGILWAASLPNAPRFSCAQPLVVGDRVIVNADPSFLICFDKMTGKRLWADYCGHSEFANAQERQAKPDLFQQIDPKAARIKKLASSWTGTVEQQVELHGLATTLPKLLRQVDDKKYAAVADRQEAGSAGLTSCTDGKYVYTWYADGVAVCHDLDGKRKWMILENEGRSGGTGNDAHGYRTSPILTDREFIVGMMHYLAFDRETGKILWKMPTNDYRWPPRDPGEPITAPGTPCINYEALGLYKPGVGFFPWHSATVTGKKAYVLDWAAAHTGTVTTQYTIPETITEKTRLKGRTVSFQRDKEWGLLALGSCSGADLTANVLVHDGLIYTVAMAGPLRVYDAETLAPVYSVRLDMNTIMFAYPYPHGSGVCASPALGGKHIYIFGNGGHSMVIKPGRKFELVAENRIERLLPGRYRGSYPPVPANQGAHPECTVSSPIFDGDRIYYQGEGYLYCIGKPR
jgi:outer membrane protein assembly factor BamB